MATRSAYGEKCRRASLSERPDYNQPAMTVGGPYARRISFGGLSGPHARDLLLLVGVLFVTFSMQFLPGLSLVPESMRLSTSVWRQGMVWQLVSYPAAGWGGPSIWFLLQLLIFYMFANQVRWALGRRRFWNLLWMTSAVAAVVAVAVQYLLSGVSGGGADAGNAFLLMQGQRMLLVIAIAAFALVQGNATILLFFVLPIRAKWFIAIELVFAWVGFLGTGDLAGFLGICTAVGAAFVLLRPRRAARVFRDARLRAERWYVRQKLARGRRRFRVVPGGRKRDDDDPVRRGPWVN